MARPEWRFEGLLGLTARGDVGDAPVSIGFELRAATEPDYRSLSGLVRLSVELFQRNTTIAAFGGYGSDRVLPLEPPPGQIDLWPATHDRWGGGLTVTQLLTRRLSLSAGFGASFQRGMLANPYRRALVRTSLFPEVLPATRDRFTGFVSLAWHLGWDLALHLRLGGYADDWGVRAIVPEVGLAKEVGRLVLLTLTYRYYDEGPARFYDARYEDLAEIMTGDARLGPLHEHAVAAEGRWTLAGERGAAGALTVHAGYELGLLTYELLATDLIVSHVISLGASATF